MPTTAFLTDSTLCIGCKACEVACKEWNDVPADDMQFSGLSYDNTLTLGHSSYRHVKFVEQPPVPGFGGNSGKVLAWAFSSDVCKHCEVAGCLEHCPTGSIVRTEFGGVYVQPDVCNGCGYCIVGCPFGVLDRRPDDGRAFKCTFCYDRQKGGLEPACAKACPTKSILFGEIDDLRRVADERVAQLKSKGIDDASVYDPRDTSVKGIHAMFIVRGDVRLYNLPPAPEVPSALNATAWASAAATAAIMAVGAVLALLTGTGKRREPERSGALGLTPRQAPSPKP